MTHNTMKLEDFPPTISFDHNGNLQWHLDKFKDVYQDYRSELHKIRDLKFIDGAPVPCKSFTVKYDHEHDPKYMLCFWQKVNEYIKDMEDESETWTFCHLEEDEEDTNTDPYEDWELFTPRFTVYAYIKSDIDITTTEEYTELLKEIAHSYKETTYHRDQINRLLSK